VAQEAMRDALIPNLDQTRSTGIVTLPGAFIGALFGGASPVEAARFQVVVLSGILLAQTVASFVLTRRLSRMTVIPALE
jgi:putative ABC transport system permease protein